MTRCVIRSARFVGLRGLMGLDVAAGVCGGRSNRVGLIGMVKRLELEKEWGVDRVDKVVGVSIWIARCCPTGDFKISCVLGVRDSKVDLLMMLASMRS